jgi:xanthine dehydrogenase small subunit
MMHGRRVWTAAGLAALDPTGGLHPAQQALIELSGSQCGYCTPGFVSVLVEAAHRPELAEAPADDWRLADQLSGNLCRCTGYRPIQQALRAVAGTCPPGLLPTDRPPGGPVQYEAQGQRFQAPTSLDEALVLLAEDPPRIVCGASDLALDINLRHRRFPSLLSLERIPELRAIEEEPARIRLGAALPLTELEAWSAEGLPVLHRMLRYFGSRPIKQRATLGGNLANASPIGDLAPVLLALDALLLLASASGERRVPIASFFTGYRQTALRPGELIAAVEIPRPAPGTRLGAYKVSRRRELDISAVAACFALREEDGRITHLRLAYGGMAATPARASQTEAALLGQAWTPAALRAAWPSLDQDFQPMDDHRGSAAFRRSLARNLLLGFQLETARHEQRALHVGHTGTVAP